MTQKQALHHRSAEAAMPQSIVYKSINKEKLARRLRPFGRSIPGAFFQKAINC